jgi:arylsulfatase A-like enzyme
MITWLQTCIAAVLISSAVAQDKPNIILIMADDQGSADLGCYGAKDLHTPHTDALATTGLRLTRFYSAAPVCSPSRAGTLTGRWPARAGVPNNCASQPGHSGALPSSEITMAEMFKSAGYATAHIGKWHIGYTQDTSPNAQGFDHSFGHMGGCIDNYSHFFYWSGPNRHDLWRNGEEVFHDGKFFPDLMRKEATTFMERQKDDKRPFFLYYALNTPHYPYQGDPKWLEHFKHLPYPRNLYAAFLAAQDQRIGELLTDVKRLGLRENTIIVFQSDNGHSTEDRAHGGGGSSGPFRGEKFSLFEGGIRLPALISWPGHLPENQTRNQLFHACDFFPTLAELANIELPKIKLDGRSQVSALRNPSAPSAHDGSSLHWQIGTGKNAYWAVMENHWKLIGNPSNKNDELRLFLSNLETDAAESTNHANQHPEIVDRLLEMHRNHLK